MERVTLSLSKGVEPCRRVPNQGRRFYWASWSAKISFTCVAHFRGSTNIGLLILRYLSETGFLWLFWFCWFYGTLYSNSLQKSRLPTCPFNTLSADDRQDFLLINHPLLHPPPNLVHRIAFGAFTRVMPVAVFYIGIKTEGSAHAAAVAAKEFYIFGVFPVV